MESALKHKYPVGATVYFTASNVARPAATGTYEVIRLLPTEGDEAFIDDTNYPNFGSAKAPAAE